MATTSPATSTGRSGSDLGYPQGLWIVGEETVAVSLEPARQVAEIDETPQTEALYWARKARVIHNAPRFSTEKGQLSTGRGGSGHVWGAGARAEEVGAWKKEG